MKFPVVLAAIAATLPVSVTHAADENGNPVVVTASRSAQTVDNALASVTIINAEDIANSQALSVEEILEGVAGIDITNSGGFGKLTSVRLRGTESDHVAVLIDGARIGSATSGTIPWADIPLSNIEKIEIVRGPRSSLYGADAIGGVIQIFTKKADGKQSSASFGAGNRNTKRLNASVSSQNGIAWHSISLERFNTDGINSTDENFFAPEPDKDPYKRNSFAARGGVTIKDAASFEINAQYSDGTSHYDGSTTFPNIADFEQQLVSTVISMKAGEGSMLKFQGSQSRDSTHDYRADGSVTPDDFATERDQYSFQSDIDFGRAGLVNAGVDYQNDTIDSTVAYTQTSRYNSGVFLQYSRSGKIVDIQAAVRKDNNEWYDSDTTGNFSLGGRLGSIRIIASYGTGFRAPTFNDLFWNDPATAAFFVGNPNLLPETSRSTEVSFRGRHKKLGWELNAYSTKIIDLITYNFPTVINIDKAEIEGVEASVNTEIQGIRLNANMTALDPRDANTDNILPRRSRRTARLGISYAGRTGLLGLEGIYHGKRYNDVNNINELDSYMVGNLVGRLSLSKSWSLRARIDNMFNEEYQTVSTYNQAGRTVFISLHYE